PDFRCRGKHMNRQSTDVVVIGGGPAGSTVSTLLAQHGVRVTLFERERFPRFHIGESLIPETYWVFKRLGMLDKMKASPFVKKFTRRSSSMRAVRARCCKIASSSASGTRC